MELCSTTDESLTFSIMSKRKRLKPTVGRGKPACVARPREEKMAAPLLAELVAIPTENRRESIIAACADLLEKAVAVECGSNASACEAWL